VWENSRPRLNLASIGAVLKLSGIVSFVWSRPKASLSNGWRLQNPVVEQHQSPRQAIVSDVLACGGYHPGQRDGAKSSQHRASEETTCRRPDVLFLSVFLTETVRGPHTLFAG
jgi:hypothetical protein